MKKRLVSAALFVATSAVQAQFAAPLTFDSQPAAATFATAGAAQSLTLGDLSVGGGVVLGIPPWTSFESPGTVHTAYATSHLGDDSLQSALTLNIAGTWRYQRITGRLFNGLPGSFDYVVDGYRAGQLVARDEVRVGGGETELFELGFGQGIDQLVFRTAQADPGLWDFGVYYSVFSAPVPVPEPSTWALALAGAACIGAARQRSRRRLD
jgi:hypothetical protein